MVTKSGITPKNKKGGEVSKPFIFDRGISAEKKCQKGRRGGGAIKKSIGTGGALKVLHQLNGEEVRETL